MRSEASLARRTTSVPWKAYLASREFQHLASDLADAIFAAAPVARLQGAARPVSLTLGISELLQEGEPFSGLWLPRLRNAAMVEPRELPLGAHGSIFDRG